MTHQPGFLPLSGKEGEKLGIRQFDIILVTGDAYVDHPSFGTALIGRVLWDAGFTVGIIAQPDWKTSADFTELGKPRLFFGISSGNVDSMVNNFTPNLKRRSDDVYSPAGFPNDQIGQPLFTPTGYMNCSPKHRSSSGGSRQVSEGLPIMITGRIASGRQSLLTLRQICLYSAWERSRWWRLPGGLHPVKPWQSLRDVRGTAFRMEIAEWRSKRPEGIIELPGFTEVAENKTSYARAFAMHYLEQDPFRGKTVTQPHPKTVVFQNPPALPLSTKELDHIYDLPFSRRAHPSYSRGVPALEPVQFSITSHRGCFGACSFCALTHHQGRIIQSRSSSSIIREATRMTKMPEFKGIVQDVGGPTANMYCLSCELWEKQGACRDKHCSPSCKNLDTSHRHQGELLKKLREIPGVKKVFISSGIRYDLVIADDSGYLEMICDHHVSGHLKVAPEHVIKNVTDIMNKPDREVFNQFCGRFEALQKDKKKRQYLLPYFMSGHPGCSINDMVELAVYIHDHQLYTEQVQDFTPTPMSVSTCMYYTGLNPFTLEPVHVPRGNEKKIQRALMQYRDPGNRRLVVDGLNAAGRCDLIGNGRQFLIPARDRESLKKRHKTQQK